MAPGALPLVVTKDQMGDIEDAGITVGVGDPAVVFLVTPDCGCDACDSGSQDALDELDEYMLSVVTGSYRRLWRGEREITVILGENCTWSASGNFGRGEIDKILANPRRWNELTGAPWFKEENQL